MCAMKRDHVKTTPPLSHQVYYVVPFDTGKQRRINDETGQPFVLVTSKKIRKLNNVHLPNSGNNDNSDNENSDSENSDSSSHNENSNASSENRIEGGVVYDDAWMVIFKQLPRTVTEASLKNHVLNLREVCTTFKRVLGKYPFAFWDNYIDELRDDRPPYSTNAKFADFLEASMRYHETLEYP